MYTSGKLDLENYILNIVALRITIYNGRKNPVYKYFHNSTLICHYLDSVNYNIFKNINIQNSNLSNTSVSEKEIMGNRRSKFKDKSQFPFDLNQFIQYLNGLLQTTKKYSSIFWLISMIFHLLYSTVTRRWVLFLLLLSFNLVSKSTSEFHWPSQYWGPLYRGGYSCSGQSQVLSDIIHFLAPHSRVRMRTSNGLSRFSPGWGIMRQNSFDIIAPLHIWSLKILKVKINKLTLNRNLIFMFQLNFDRVFTRGS